MRIDPHHNSVHGSDSTVTLKDVPQATVCVRAQRFSWIGCAHWDRRVLSGKHAGRVRQAPESPAPLTVIVFNLCGEGKRVAGDEIARAYEGGGARPLGDARVLRGAGWRRDVVVRIVGAGRRVLGGDVEGDLKLGGAVLPLIAGDVGLAASGDRHRDPLAVDGDGAGGGGRAVFGRRVVVCVSVHCCVHVHCNIKGLHTSGRSAFTQV